MTKTKTVTLNALVKRINRKLAPDGERFCVSRAGEVSNLGEFHTIHVARNSVEASHQNAIDVARELGVIAPDERLEE